MFGLRVIRVRGRSMEPTLKDGDLAIGRGPSRFRQPECGDVVLFRLPGVGLSVKRLHQKDGSQFRLRGDSPLSAPTVDLPRVGNREILAILRWRLRGLRLARLGSPVE